jgi:hypothetical protein
VTDRTGIYMNAGALLAIYSRKREYTTEECEVPDLLKVSILYLQKQILNVMDDTGSDSKGQYQIR